MTTTAALYARISNDPTGLRAGVERQEADCRALATRQGWSVGEVLVDNDISAFSGRPRPAYLQLLELLREGRVGAVIAWHPDRLHRSPLELEEFIDLVNDTGAVVTTVQTGPWDLSTPSGRLAARQLGAVARYESEHRAERIRRKQLELALAGKVHGGGTRPFGYESDRHTVRDDEAARVREAVEHVRAGGSLGSLAARFEREGVPTVTGRPWRTQTLRTLVTSPRIAGMREHRGAITADAAWPAIVDRDAWEEARAILAARPRRKGTGSGVARRYLLTGLAVCGVCGERLVARPRPGGVRAYVCASGVNFNGCGRVRRMAEPVEGLVKDMVIAALDGPGLADALRAQAGDDRQTRRLADSLRGYRARLDQLGEAHFVEGVVDRAEYMRRRAALEGRIADAETALARRVRRGAVSGLPAGGSGLSDWWQSADLDRRRALVGLAVERVVVQPAVRGLNRFDPSRIEVVWAK
jgi:DNA invertase Pin-like site-specific DNA recombinase